MACDLLMFPCLTAMQKLVFMYALGLSFNAWFFWPWNAEKDITKRKKCY